MSFVGVGQSAPAGGGTQPVTDQPDLISAKITQKANLADANPSRVEACFDSPIGSAIAAQFQLRNVEVTTTQVAGAANLIANTNCVELQFPAASNVGSFSLLEVQPGAVTPIGGGAGTNPAGTAALEGSDVQPAPGRTAGPNVLSTSRQVVGNTTRVTFTFDKAITPGSANAGGFSYYTQAGVRQAGGAVTGETDRTVEITFPTNAIPANARFGVLFGSVTTANGAVPNFGEVVGSGTSAPANTGAPEIKSATRVGGQNGNTFDVVYDQDVTVNNPGLCFAGTSTNVYPGSAAQRVAANTLRVTFGSLPADTSDEVVRIYEIIGGCATDLATPGLLSIEGSTAVINKDHTPGFTSGPDLTGCTKVTGSSTDFDFIFDETIDANTALGANAGFQLFDQTGTEATGGAGGVVTQVADNVATVRFTSGQFGAAVSCVAQPGAVTSNENEPNPLGAVKSGTTQVTPEPTGTATATTSPTTAPTTSPTTAPTTTPTVNPGGRAIVRGRIAKIKSPGRRVKGKIVARGACKRNRRVVVQKGRKVLGKDRSSFKGTFNIRTRAHKKGKLVVKVRSKKTKTLNCRPISKRVPGRN